MILLCIVLCHASSFGLMGSQGSDINGFIFLNVYFEDVQLFQLSVALCPISCGSKMLRNNLAPFPIRIKILSQKKIYTILPLVILEHFFFNLPYYIAT